jgi:hypothetical protein
MIMALSSAYSRECDYKDGWYLLLSVTCVYKNTEI